jgi:outer membrane protein assembly factor BamE (lipoprotein component of BamABCDE complex)
VRSRAVSLIAVFLAFSIVDGCSWCRLHSTLAPTVTQHNLMALRFGMPESEVHAILGPPLSGHLTTTPYGRPSRWYYAETDCRGNGWTVELQTWNGKLFGFLVFEGHRSVFQCFDGLCPQVLDAELFATLPPGGGTSSQ